MTGGPGRNAGDVLWVSDSRSGCQGDVADTPIEHKKQNRARQVLDGNSGQNEDVMVRHHLTCRVNSLKPLSGKEREGK